MPPVPETFNHPVDAMWCRIVMNRQVRRLMRGLPSSKLKALEISGKYWQHVGGFRDYKSLSFPDYDLCSGPLPETFDVIIAEQVFEHLLWPYRAAKNIHQMLNPGGHFLLTTPFLLRIHNEPTDCTRWSETGLRYLLAECGFPESRITTGSWGNRECVTANFGRWAVFKPEMHSLHNEPHYPIVVWAFAQKEPASDAIESQS